MEKEVKFENVLCALLLFKQELTYVEIVNIVGEFFLTNPGFKSVDSPLTTIDQFFYNDGECIKIKEGIELDSPLCDKVNHKKEYTLEKLLFDNADQSVYNHLYYRTNNISYSEDELTPYQKKEKELYTTKSNIGKHIKIK